MNLEKFRVDAFFIISILIVLTAILTWVMPGGQYERVEQDGRQIVVEGSFTPIPNEPQTLFDVLKAPVKGFADTANIIFFVLVIGGFFAILDKTGVVNVIIKNMALFFNSHRTLKTLFVPTIMLITSLGGAILGLGEELIVMIPLFVSISLILGYDSIVAAAITLLGAATGYASAFLNPFNVGIAQGIAELPLYSGIGYRFFVWVIFTLISIIFTTRYAIKVEKNPKTSLTYKTDLEKRKDLKVVDKKQKMDLNHKLIIVSFIGGLFLLVFGVIKYGWYINEISALFLGLAVLTAILNRMKPINISTAFADGAASLIKIAIFIAFARAIVIVANDGNILDPILNALASVFSRVHPLISAELMLLSHSFLSFFIGSSSGEAVLTIPILAPLSDLIGLSRQITILAYQLGHGIVQIFVPTSPIVLAILGLAGVSLSQWFKWCWKLVLILTITAMLLLIPPYFMGW